MKQIYLFLLVTFCFVNVSHAAIADLRAHAGLHIIDPKDFNAYLSSKNIKQLYILPQIGASAFVRPLPLDLGVGLRYDYHSIKLNAADGTNANEMEFKLTRLSLVAYYHLIDTAFFVGPIAGLGIMHKPNISVKISNATSTYDEAIAQSFFLAGEVGFKFTLFQIGAEGGYESISLKGIKGANGHGGFDFDSGGMYVLGFAGVVL